MVSNGVSYRFSQHIGKQYTYGYRKITALINQCYTSPINHKKVQRIMQKHHLNYGVRPKKGIIRSMSRKGTPADNASIESFHSSLKSKIFYINNQFNNSNNIVIDIVEKYIKNYNNRIQQKLGYLPPVKYRELAA